MRALYGAEGWFYRPGTGWKKLGLRFRFRREASFAPEDALKGQSGFFTLPEYIWRPVRDPRAATPPPSLNPSRSRPASLSGG